MSIENKYKKIIVSGKRKTAVARALIYEGTGEVTINGKNIDALNNFDRLQIQEPLRIAETILEKINFNVRVKMSGGGSKGQIDAARLAIASISNICRG